MKKKILIQDLICNASVGIHEIEKKNKQKIIINLEILLNTNVKTNTDNIKDVADYGKFRRVVLDVINSNHYNLIETLAEIIMKKIKINKKVKHVKILITKPDIFDDCNVSCEISDYL